MRWLKGRRSGSKLDGGPESAEPPARLSHIDTERLRLRPVQTGDIETLHRLWTAPGVRAGLWAGHLLSLEQTRDLSMQSVHLFEEGGHGLWLAFHAEHPVGFCGYWQFRDAHELELMYAVDEGEWLRGYAREMAAAMVAYGFEQLRLDEIRAATDRHNPASQRVLRRLGFLPDACRGRDGKLGFRLLRQRREANEEDWQAA